LICCLKVAAAILPPRPLDEFDEKDFLGRKPKDEEEDD